MMRLNRVESFYTFLLCFRSEGSEEWRPTMASPHVGLTAPGQVASKAPSKEAAGCSQVQPEREPSSLVRGDSCLQAEAPPGGSVDCGQPIGATVARKHSRLQRGACKGGRLQGARKGLPPAASPDAKSGGDANCRGGRPLAGQLPAGKGSRCLRRGSGGGGEGERVVRASFGERMILPL
ncbi:hypothetical protein B296_00018141 [Ensete ventricosum]|uniref:Uncharacterized protein n=1 Tax=Ensete ventricosum TaxID=4639 RepID=A0A426Z398_ENSVE|nr:hypothetical protein B296_00018141 [Ensete ventricosum]